MTGVPRAAIRVLLGSLDWLLPSFFDLFFLLYLGYAIVRVGTVISTDGDPARQLTIGQYILATGTIPRVDLFSHTKAGEPFLAYEWLAEVLSAASYAAFGLAGPVLLYGALIGTTFGILLLALRARGHGLLLSASVVSLAAATSAIGWVARPHVWTYLGTVLCWALLDAWRAGRLSPGRLWLLPPLTLIWANLHGGFLVAWLLIGTYFAADVARWLTGTQETRAAALARLRQLIPPTVAALLIVVVNPFGLEMLAHVFNFFGHRFLQVTDEFLSPEFHSGRATLFLIMLLATLAALGFSRRVLSLEQGALLIIFTAAAHYAIRNIPLFAIIVAPILVAQLEALPRLEVRGGVAASIGAWLRKRSAAATAGDAQRHPGVIAGLALAALCFTAASQWRAGQVPLGAGFDPTQMPVAAAEYARANPPAGNMFNSFAWGGYLLHRLWPQQRVFIDGQTDFFGDEIVHHYMTVAALGEGWAELLDRYHVGWVIFETDSPLVRHLKSTGGWVVVHEDPLATVLVRAPSSTAGAGPGFTQRSESAGRSQGIAEHYPDDRSVQTAPYIAGS